MSDLYKIALTVNNPKFIMIVSAAILKHAQTITLGGTLTNEKNFAIWALKNPLANEFSMISLVASDPNVLAAVTIGEGDVINIDSVPDSAVTSVVSAKWSLVASKYPTTSPA